jgi:hypothetical protein
MLALVRVGVRHRLLLLSPLVVVVVVRITKERSAAHHHRQVILVLGQTGVVAAVLVKHRMDYPLTGHQLQALQLRRLPESEMLEEPTNTLVVVAIEVALEEVVQERKVDRWMFWPAAVQVALEEMEPISFTRL